MTTTEPKQKTIITADQYRALQRQVELPTPQALFDFVVETLVAKELATYKHADPFRNKLPSSGLFLLIPPRPEELDLAHLMELIEFRGKTGTNHLNAGNLKDEVKVPDGPYLVTDAEDGSGRLNTKPSVSKANILKENRSPYLAFEGIIHTVVFPSVFETHNMDLCGSRCKGRGVPDLYLNDDKPKLNADWYDSASPEWGAPSCGSRVGA